MSEVSHQLVFCNVQEVWCCGGVDRSRKRRNRGEGLKEMACHNCSITEKQRCLAMLSDSATHNKFVSRTTGSFPAQGVTEEGAVESLACF